MYQNQDQSPVVFSYPVSEPNLLSVIISYPDNLL